MLIQILQTPNFVRQKKKIQKNEISDLDAAVRIIQEEPKIGTEKRGDLQGVRVYKFKMNKQECLLAYELMTPLRVALLAFGPHENFYRDLKKHL